MNSEISPALPIAGALRRREGIDHDKGRARKRLNCASNRSGRPKGRSRGSADFDSFENGYLYFCKMCDMCGALHFISERKKGSSLANPKLSACCSNSLIDSRVVPRFSNTPSSLKCLLNKSNSDSRSFRKNIRKHNSALAMASVTSNWISLSVGTSVFNRTWTILERIHHFIDPLNPSEGLRPRYLSVFIHDSIENESERANHRQQDVPGVSTSVLYCLEQMLRNCNFLVQNFLSVRELCRDQEVPESIRLVIPANRRP